MVYRKISEDIKDCALPDPPQRVPTTGCSRCRYIAALEVFLASEEVLIHSLGCILLYLPPYSPDLNPIEEAFSSMKAWIRANRDFVLEQLNPRYEAGDPIDMIRQAVFTVTPEKAWGWFKHSGYVSNEPA